jgi:hypothetical protein
VKGPETFASPDDEILAKYRGQVQRTQELAASHLVSVGQPAIFLSSVSKGVEYFSENKFNVRSAGQLHLAKHALCRCDFESLALVANMLTKHSF